MRVFPRVAVALVSALCVLAGAQAGDDRPLRRPHPVCEIERRSDGTVLSQACPGELGCELGPTRVLFQNETLDVWFCVIPGTPTDDDDKPPIPVCNACELSTDVRSVPGPRVCAEDETCTGGPLLGSVPRRDKLVEAKFCVSADEDFDELSALLCAAPPPPQSEGKQVTIPPTPPPLKHKKKFSWKKRGGDDVPPTPPPLKHKKKFSWKKRGAKKG